MPLDVLGRTRATMVRVTGPQKIKKTWEISGRKKGGFPGFYPTPTGAHV